MQRDRSQRREEATILGLAVGRQLRSLSLLDRAGRNLSLNRNTEVVSL